MNSVNKTHLEISFAATTTTISISIALATATAEINNKQVDEMYFKFVA